MENEPVNGDETETEVNEGIGVKPVHVKTENFDALAFPLYEMPGKRVMEAMTAGEDKRAQELFAIFQLSIVDQEKLKDLDTLSFRELNSVVAKWLALSNQYEPDDSEEEGTDDAGVDAPRQRPADDDDPTVR